MFTLAVTLHPAGYGRLTYTHTHRHAHTHTHARTHKQTSFWMTTVYCFNSAEFSHIWATDAYTPTSEVGQIHTGLHANRDVKVESSLKGRFWIRVHVCERVV